MGKHMKMSSGKPMEELCAPMVTTVMKKMAWIPPDEDITPDIVCLSTDKLKERYPDHVATAEATQKSANKADDKKDEFIKTAKELKEELNVRAKAVLSKWSKELEKEMASELRAAADKVLGGSAASTPKDKLLASVQDSLSLSTKGVETKMLQKLNEAVGSWAVAAKKEEL